MKRTIWRLVFIQKQLKGWIVVLTAAVALFALLALTLPGSGGSGMDQSVQRAMANLRSDTATSLFKPFSNVGSTAAIAVITLLASILIAWRQGIWRGVSVIGSVLAAFILNTLLKKGFDRIRPEDAWGITADGASFPSGNAMLAIVMFGMIAISAAQSRSASKGIKWVVCTAAVIVIAMMGLSRVYFNVHYTSDIIGGFAAGLAVISVAQAVMLLANKK
ncbi:phosphatase PAP2 family protein [Paenibacillus harenae]|uniref:phosphatase PAP2 family protein n=1 Tax=Paenibacillus harenae TaxID=306543 RepID=UPI002793A431|nr:phosphatase PAP2 family protein [Paenibacillus harenae]MDQ0058099.1 undecaprenyl-diphosphatase [Paenibacillus harenae]